MNVTIPAKKHVLVTGGARGTGYAIAERFAREGFCVSLTSRSKESAVEAARILSAEYGVECMGYACDQGDMENIRQVFDCIAASGLGLDVLILNGADLGMNMNPLTVAPGEWDQVIRTNLTGGFYSSQQAALLMMEMKKGAIVFIGSNVCRRAIRNRSAYVASKGGIVSLVKALAVDFGKYSIRVNCLLPGSIHTERWDTFDEQTLAAKRERVPIGREASYEDIANGAYFLAGSEAGNITGTELMVDGGVDSQLFPGV